MTGIEYIAKERQRQIEEEGWTPEHDDEHIFGELAQAAACYAHPNRVSRLDMVGWPADWDLKWWKPSENSDIDGRIKELSKSGAMIAAEIDRLLRMKAETKQLFRYQTI